MASPNLTDDQRNAWAHLVMLIDAARSQAEKIDAVRQFALDLIEQGDEKSIRVNTNKFYEFTANESKTDFIQKHRNNGVWGNDAILNIAMMQLGYNIDYAVYAEGKDKPEQEYSLEQKSAPFSIKINCYNVVKQHKEISGTHFDLKDAKTISNGNCMYHAMLIQIERDLPRVQPLLAPAKSLPKVKETASARLFTAYEGNEHAIFEKIENESAERETEAAALFERLSTKQLIELYQFALKNPVDKYDDYLQGRLKASQSETGSDVLAKAINNQSINANENDLLHAELLHALTKEAWCSAEAFENLKSEYKVIAPTLRR